MAEYHLTWITDSLAAGYAPMSYEELDSIRSQGIDSIVNLCGEFTDLYAIEEKYGFDVYYLPLADETAPDLDSMERCLEWIDEAIFLGKKVLVHCHHGIGRTGTVITAYLLRRGLGMKVASATLKLKNSRANPANYTQWQLVKKYGKSQGRLTLREPSLESKNIVDLGVYFTQYEALFSEVEEKVTEYDNEGHTLQRCGKDNDACCHSPFNLFLLECVYLINHINRKLKNQERKVVRERASHASALIRAGMRKAGKGHELFAVSHTYKKEKITCPLSSDGRCILFDYRPLRCRYAGLPLGSIDTGLFRKVLESVSKELFLALTGNFPEGVKLEFSSLDAMSGKFIEEYFSMTARKIQATFPISIS